MKIGMPEDERQPGMTYGTATIQPPDLQFKGQSTSLDAITGFVKHDSGKPRFSLIPAEARLEVAKVFTHGAKKYPPGNFRKGADWSRYIDAMYRHMSAWEMGNDLDDESGLNHLAHACACAMILLTMQETKVGVDDRA